MVISPEAVAKRILARSASEGMDGQRTMIPRLRFGLGFLVNLSHAVAIVMLIFATNAIAAEPRIAFDGGDGMLAIRIDDQPFAEYVWEDDEISRPYFANVHAPGGLLVTRPHPPGPDDLQDHATFHPGIWLAFGDLSGHDSWRLKAPVVHDGFVERPMVRDGVASFTVRNLYQSEDGATTICTETCRYEVRVTEHGYLLTMDSSFTSPSSFSFGDQEEMGLGVRLATSIAENQGQGGLLTDSEERTTAAEVWGEAADWCDYSGPVVKGGDVAGVTIFSHPDNFRPCWWHARNYGFVTANPFGRKALTGGEVSRVVVEPGKEFRLRFGVLMHAGRPGEGYSPGKAYQAYRRVE